MKRNSRFRLNAFVAGMLLCSFFYGLMNGVSGWLLLIYVVLFIFNVVVSLLNWADDVKGVVRMRSCKK